jgi:ankyrin repeat protein
VSVGGLLFYERDHDVRMKQGLIAAIEKGNSDEVLKLLSAGADPNTVTTKLVNKPSVGNLLRCTLPDDIRKRGDHKTTALMMAVMSRHGYLVSLLLDKGAHVNEQDEYGSTALNIAVAEGRLDMVQQLLEHGADANQPNLSRLPTLNWAIMLRESSIVHALLEKGADARAEDGTGMSALYLACVGEDVPVARLLLDKGASASTTYKGWSTLRLAVSVDNPDLVRLLLEKGADSDEKLPDGRSLLQSAIENKRFHVIPLLKPSQPLTVKR